MSSFVLRGIIHHTSILLSHTFVLRMGQMSDQIIYIDVHIQHPTSYLRVTSANFSSVFSSGLVIIRVSSLPLRCRKLQGQRDTISVNKIYTNDMQKDQNILYLARVNKDYKKSITTEVALVVRNLLKIFRSEYFTIVLLFPIAPCRHDNFPVAFL